MLSTTQSTFSSGRQLQVAPCTPCFDANDSYSEQFASRQLELPGFGLVTCSVIEQGLPLLLTADQEECRSLQSLGTYCGCPVRSDACELECVNSSALVSDFPGAEDVPTSCEIVNSYLQSFAQDSAECVQYKERWSDTCACDSTAETDTSPSPGSAYDEPSDTEKEPPSGGGCPLCIHGGTMAYPEKDLGQFLDLTQDNYFASLALQAARSPNVTCAMADIITRSGVLPSQVCDSDEMSFVAGICGCPAHPVDPCQLCPTNDMTMPDEILGNAKAAYGIQAPCGIAAAALTQAPSTDKVCWNVKVDAWLCGCNEGTPWYLGASKRAQHVTLAWLPRISGFLSLLGSIYIIQAVLRRFRKNDSTTYHLILLGMSVFDISSSIAWMFSTTPLPAYDTATETESGVYGAMGNDTTCKVQGFFLELGFIGSTGFNASLTTFYLLSIVYRFREASMKPLRRYLLAIPSILAFALAAAAIPYYRPFFVACLVSNPNSEMNSKWVYLIVFSIIPVGTAIIISILNMGAICRYVWVNSRKADRWRFPSNTRQDQYNSAISTASSDGLNDLGSSRHSNDSFTPKADRVRRGRRRPRSSRAEGAVFWQAFWYVIAFLLTWGFYILGQFKPYFSSSDGGLYAFWVIMVISNPLMGFWNAFVYVKPWMWKWKFKQIYRSQGAQASDES